MRTKIQSQLPKQQTDAMLKNLLGSLELEIMEHMWEMGEANVHQVTDAIKRRRPIAYTTVMTVMTRLVEKGILRRIKEGKRYCYHTVQGKEQYLYRASRNMVRSLVKDFGDLAIAGFLGEVNQLDEKRLKELRKLVEGASGENNASQ